MSAIWDDVLIDPNYSAQATSGGPEFSTTIVSTPAGFKQRNIDRADYISRYTINYELMTAAQFRSFRGFFIARSGMARGFRFSPPDDNTATNDLLINSVTGNNTGDGSTTVFRCWKKYTSGPVAYSRRIVKLVGGMTNGDTRPSTVSARVNGSGATIASVDYTQGLITFSAAPGNGLVVDWSGGYDLPVNFGSDWLNAQVLDVATNTQLGQIELIEQLWTELNIT